MTISPIVTRFRARRMRIPSMKLRTGLLLGVAFGAGMASAPPPASWRDQFGFGSSLRAFAQDAGRAETYRLLTLFGDVFERVRAEYVEPVNDRDLIENAINGMLTGLDPHSNYMNAKSFRDMQVQTRGEFGGLGIEVTQESGTSRSSARSTTPRPAGPASSRATSSWRWTARP